MKAFRLKPPGRPMAAIAITSCRLMATTSVLAALAASVASAASERLVFTLPPGWGPLHAADTETFQQTFFAPDDQDADQWADMVVVSMTRERADQDVRSMHRRSAEDYSVNCVTYTTGAMRTSVENGASRSFWTMGCNRRRDLGVGEASFFLYLQGKDGGYLVQRIWRTAPFEDGDPPIDAAQRDGAIAFLKDVRLEDVK